MHEHPRTRSVLERMEPSSETCDATGAHEGARGGFSRPLDSLRRPQLPPSLPLSAPPSIGPFHRSLHLL
eukprot:4410763-Pleurochrysis_carterae.AAC.1